jgi:hypothetical protein
VRQLMWLRGFVHWIRGDQYSALTLRPEISIAIIAKRLVASALARDQPD